MIGTTKAPASEGNLETGLKKRNREVVAREGDQNSSCNGLDDGHDGPRKRSKSSRNATSSGIITALALDIPEVSLEDYDSEGVYVGSQKRSNSNRPRKPANSSGKLSGTVTKSTIQANQYQYGTDGLTKPKDTRTKGSRVKSITGEEKRLKRVRVKAPVSWLERLERAVSQRMFVVERQRREVNGIPEEAVELVGSTGNIYTVTIKQVPVCTCPDGQKGNQCKHIIYVLRLVLKAPSHLEYQAAFLVSELEQIFELSPLPQVNPGGDAPDESNRKAVEGDCPICFMEFDPGREKILWCKAACGNNIHRECFEQWAKSHVNKEVRCVYCRSVWKGDEPSLERIKASKASISANREGYINVAAELGISTYRDTSSYHQFWVNRQYRSGHNFDSI